MATTKSGSKRTRPKPTVNREDLMGLIRDTLADGPTRPKGRDANPDQASEEMPLAGLSAIHATNAKAVVDTFLFDNLDWRRRDRNHYDRQAFAAQDNDDLRGKMANIGLGLLMEQVHTNQKVSTDHRDYSFNTLNNIDEQVWAVLALARIPAFQDAILTIMVDGLAETLSQAGYTVTPPAATTSNGKRARATRKRNRK